MISAAWRVFHQSSGTALRSITGRIGATLHKLITLDKLDVFVCTSAIILQPNAQPDISFRPLTKDDFAKIRHRTDRFGEQIRLYYEKRGIDSAFGVFVDGELGHISWVYTAKEYEREPYVRFRLDIGEAEIVNCFTADTYRGRGLYPHAIQLITAMLLERGFSRVFMNIVPSNEASRRGVLKAGLTKCGRVFHLRCPVITRWQGWYRRKMY